MIHSHRVRLGLIVVSVAAATFAALGRFAYTPPDNQHRFGLPDEAVHAAGTYEYGTWQDAGNFIRAYIWPYDDDFTAYKGENDARIDNWAGSPGTAPPINGDKVAVTFRSTLSASSVQAIMSANNFTLWSYSLAGRTVPDEDEAFEHEYGPSIDASKIGVSLIDPGCSQEPEACEAVIYSGVLQISGTVLGPADLQNLKDHPDVYLADSTGIQLRSELAATYPGQTIGDIVLPNPFWTTSGDVTWP